MTYVLIAVFNFTVDEEFEAVAIQVLNRTQGMVNKYRRLLMVEAEVCLEHSPLNNVQKTS